MCLRVEAALNSAGGLPDTRKGRGCYADYLHWQSAEGLAGKNSLNVSMSRGWALGSEAFKQDLLANHSVALEARPWPEGGAAEVWKQRWQMALNGRGYP